MKNIWWTQNIKINCVGPFFSFRGKRIKMQNVSQFKIFLVKMNFLKLNFYEFLLIPNTNIYNYILILLQTEKSKSSQEFCFIFSSKIIFCTVGQIKNETPLFVLIQIIIQE